jgi:thioredoxin 1
MFHFEAARPLIAIGLSLFFLLTFILIERWSLNKVSKNNGQYIRDNPNKNIIVYFSTPDCVACKTAQGPALQQLKNYLHNDLVVVEINTYENPELASQWGILTVPTTVLLDKKGEPKNINYGTTSFQKLLAQIEDKRKSK